MPVVESRKTGKTSSDDIDTALLRLNSSIFPHTRELFRSRGRGEGFRQTRLGVDRGLSRSLERKYAPAFGGIILRFTRIAQDHPQDMEE